MKREVASLKTSLCMSVTIICNLNAKPSTCLCCYSAVATLNPDCRVYYLSMVSEACGNALFMLGFAVLLTLFGLLWMNQWFGWSCARMYFLCVKNLFDRPIRCFKTKVVANKLFITCNGLLRHFTLISPPDRIEIYVRNSIDIFWLKFIVFQILLI